MALVTWLAGAVILFFKGYALFVQAAALRSGLALNVLPFPVALVIGGLKARTLFLKACRKNLARIDGLDRPQPWQFFRAGFFFFLVAMISLGAWLSRAAAGSYAMLLAVSSLDLSLSVALLGSLAGFWSRPGSSRVPG